MTRIAGLDLIAARYAAVHGATPVCTYPELRQHLVAAGGGAVLGYRRAHREPLFLEAYLDQPVEAVVSTAFGHAISRSEIVEIGNLAADSAPAMVALWAHAANDLGNDADVAVAVLTAPLRRMFRRLGVPLIELAPARREMLGPDGACWGAYYDLDPVVCASTIAEGQAKLARFAHRVGRCAA